MLPRTASSLLRRAASSKVPRLPSPLADPPPPPHLLASKTPRLGARTTLTQPVPVRLSANPDAPPPRTYATPWRDAWRIQQHRLARWRDAKLKWRAALRKAGKLKPRLPKVRTARTPTVQPHYRPFRPSRIYVQSPKGRALRTPSKLLVYPDGTIRRKYGAVLPKKVFASVEKPRTAKDFKRAYPVGRLKVYDRALEIIEADAVKLQEEVRQLREKLNDPKLSAAERTKIQDKINIIEIQSTINLPRPRWEVKHGFYDFSLPVHRHLVEEKWRKQGRLDLLMERVYQMGVVPDLLPAFHPNVDLRVEFPMRLPYSKRLREAVEKRGPRYAEMEPGRYLLPNQTLAPPRLRARAFHLDERLYTLVMVDPDVPDVERATFQSFAHWIVPNVPLSIHTPFALRLNEYAHQLPYVPPHPQEGTPYHRYTIFLLRQRKRVAMDLSPGFQRLGFDLRQFSAQHGLVYPAAPTSEVEYPPLPADIVPGDPRWIGRADPNSVEGGIPGGIRAGGIAGLPGPMGGREARGGVPKGVRQNAGISGRSGGRGKADEVGGGVFMWREVWTEDVSKIYRDVLKAREPKYARPTKGDRLADAKRVSKYY
ncbi:PEBP-like protein [Auricularia subglabra TFB-10046 SS5]|nr:PEBP-like protein [Auricularia subglabra TFB-10046 SS5]